MNILCNLTGSTDSILILKYMFLIFFGKCFCGAQTFGGLLHSVSREINVRVSV